VLGADGLRSYLALWPDGEHRADAEAELVALGEEQPAANDGDMVRAEDAVAFQEASAYNTSESYAAYLEAFPDGFWRSEARNRRDSLTPITAETMASGQIGPGGLGIAGDDTALYAALEIPTYGFSSVDGEPVIDGAYIHAGTPAGIAFKDCADCPEMVVVPAGSFMMGSPEDEEAHESDEALHEVVLDQALAVGRFEVTWAQWTACVDAGGCDGDLQDGAGGDEGWGRDDRPVVNVSWNDAKAYVDWLNTLEFVEGYRLLSEAEWEYAARAGAEGSYVNGENRGDLCAVGNVADHSGRDLYSGATIAECDDGFAGTAPVGSFAANAFKLYDVHGNVDEWVADCYVRDYAETSADGRPAVSGSCAARVRRGGSMLDHPREIRLAHRSRNSDVTRDRDLGFRVAMELPTR
jgi:formylglycine-generating enzyme required for sulfatase activity